MAEIDNDELEGLRALAALSGDLLALLDRIEIEKDPSLAKQRFDIAEAHGLQVTFVPTDDGVGKEH